MDETTKQNLELQVRVSKMLGRGFAYSIVPLGGICSLAAFIIGLRVRNIINRSETEIGGLGVAWWCIIVGGLETLILPPLYLVLAITYLK